MDNIVITLTNKEAYALSQSGLREPSRRKQFGAFGITKKISDQMMTQLSAAQVERLKAEWKSLKSEIPAYTPPSNPKKIAKKPAEKKSPEKLIVRDF